MMAVTSLRPSLGREGMGGYSSPAGICAFLPGALWCLKNLSCFLFLKMSYN